MVSAHRLRELRGSINVPAFALPQVQNVRDMMARVPSEITKGPVGGR